MPHEENSPTTRRTVSRPSRQKADPRAIARSTALNAVEANAIDSAAQSMGVSVSTFLRQAGINYAREYELRKEDQQETTRGISYNDK